MGLTVLVCNYPHYTDNALSDSMATATKHPLTILIVRKQQKHAQPSGVHFGFGNPERS